MRSNNVLGFIFAATLDDKIPELASSRTTASVPIGGKYRIIDFKRNKDGIPATVKSIEYDPNRTANIALICYADGEKK